MANNPYIHGMVPEAPSGTNIKTTPSIPKKVSSAAAIFVNTPVFLSSGVWDTSTTANGGGGVTGAVVVMFDSNGAPVMNLATAEVGKCVVTSDGLQRFRMTISGTDYAATDIGAMYNFTAETATAGTSGDSYSKIQLDGSSESSATRTMIAGPKTGNVTQNDAGVTGVEVYCTINPAYFVTAGF